MAKTKISEFSSTPANNTDIDSINIAEGCAPSGINDAIRELMSQLKDFQVGSAGDPVTVGGVLTVQAGSASTPSLTTAGDTNTGMFFPAADTIAFAEGGAEAMRLDSSGNLGLGVTPSAWSGYKVLQAGIASFAGGSSGAYLLQDNAYTDNSGASWKYINSSYAAAQYYAASGAHVWRTAPSGTAGNAITFTQAMTLDASGNLGVGTTSPSYRVHASGGAIRADLGSAGTSLILTGTGSNFQVDHSVSGYATLLNSGGGLAFSANGSERARIDSSGNLLLNTTSQLSEGKLCVAYSYANNQGIVLNETAGSAGQDAIRFNVQGTKVGSVSVTTTATAYNTSSDYRLKNITGPITNSGAYIDSLNPVEGTWKIDGSTFVGLIAHEAQEASRTKVATGVKDGDEMQGMSYSNSEMIANMIAELKSLRQRIATLEAK